MRGIGSGKRVAISGDGFSSTRNPASTLVEWCTPSLQPANSLNRETGGWSTSPDWGQLPGGIRVTGQGIRTVFFIDQTPASAVLACFLKTPCFTRRELFRTPRPLAWLCLCLLLAVHGQFFRLYPTRCSVPSLFSRYRPCLF